MGIKRDIEGFGRGIMEYVFLGGGVEFFSILSSRASEWPDRQSLDL